MSAATVRDAVALKILALPSARFVYANGSTDARVMEWPQELMDNGVHALVGRGPTPVTGGTGNRLVHRGIDVEWRFPGGSMAEAERLIDTLEEEILAEFASGITLGGLVYDCVFTGSERPTELLEDEREWVVWLTHFMARERNSAEFTP